MDITRHNPGPRMSQAVEHNGTVYLAGQVANDQNADVGEQTRQVLAKIDALLATCGSDKSKL
ncbi:MAG: Rid family hydrolase, partial [Alphaproteobacteria bacterium]|nr:Rid family hydrolase [Alphaproteobacteria bacterium]